MWDDVFSGELTVVCSQTPCLVMLLAIIYVYFSAYPLLVRCFVYVLYDVERALVSWPAIYRRHHPAFLHFLMFAESEAPWRSKIKALRITPELEDQRSRLSKEMRMLSSYNRHVSLYLSGIRRVQAIPQVILVPRPPCSAWLHRRVR